MDAMATMDMSAEEQSEVLQVVSGILHLGNVMFREEGNERAVVDTDQCKFGSWLTYCPKMEDSTYLHPLNSARLPRVLAANRQVRVGH